MHRQIVSGPEDMHIDHRDGNGLMNTEDNLRAATRAQNLSNQRIRGVGSSEFRGVHWHKKRKKWQASIRVNNKPIYLGIFTSELEAVRAYNIAALKHYGEFARLNDIPEAA